MPLRNRFWVESALATACAILAAVTWLWPTWIELVLRVDPDHGSGTTEWALVAALAAAAVLAAAAALAEWDRTQHA